MTKNDMPDVIWAAWRNGKEEPDCWSAVDDGTTRYIRADRAAPIADIEKAVNLLDDSFRMREAALSAIRQELSNEGEKK